MVSRLRAFSAGLLFVSFYSCAVAWAAEHNIPSDAHDHGPDLPSIGSSTFDKYFSRTTPDGKSVYEVPYPLHKLLERVSDQQNHFVHALFPFTRSLQRPRDLQYNPLLNPRIVLTPLYDRGAIARNKLFIGFVKAQDQLEVISFNDEAGRFEFQIVKNYSTQPEVFYVQRGKCLSCHQDQSPIFPAPGWEDSTFGVFGRLVRARLGFDPLDESADRRILATLFGSLASRDSVGTFDSSVRAGHQVSLDERVWLHGCGDDDYCRLGLMMATLAPGDMKGRDAIKHAESVIQFSKLQDQFYFSSFLSSTMFGAEKVVRKYGSYEELAFSNSALLEIISLLYQLPSRHNPATPRPLALKGKSHSLNLTGFTLNDKSLLQSEGLTANEIADTLRGLFESERDLFGKGPINKIRMMSLILKAAGSSEYQKYERWLQQAVAEKQLFEGDILPVFKNYGLNLLSRHCAQCHSGHAGFPPQFLAGDEDSVMRMVKELQPKMIFKLENDLMPPKKDDREIMQATGDKERILRFLGAL